MLGRMWGKGIPVHCSGAGTVSTALAVHLWRRGTSSRVKQEVHRWPRNPTPRGFPTEMKTYVYVKTCTWMFSAALFIRAKSGMSASCWMEEFNGWTTKKCSSDTCYDMDDSWKHCTWWMQPFTQRTKIHILYDFIHMKYPEERVCRE